MCRKCLVYIIKIEVALVVIYIYEMVKLLFLVREGVILYTSNTWNCIEIVVMLLDYTIHLVHLNYM